MNEFLFIANLAVAASSVPVSVRLYAKGMFNAADLAAAICGVCLGGAVLTLVKYIL